MADKYRKKPVVIEAMRWDDNDRTAHEIEQWASGAVYRVVADPTHLMIKTLEGTMTADPGDMIIKGVKGEFYPCKPDIFEATYEAVQAGTRE